MNTAEPQCVRIRKTDPQRCECSKQRQKTQSDLQRNLKPPQIFISVCSPVLGLSLHVPVYGYNTHLSNNLVCLSCVLLKWKPAGVNGMQLKDDIITLHQSLHLSLSLFEYFGAIVYSRCHSSGETPRLEGNLSQLTWCVRSMCVSGWKFKKESPAEGKHNNCSALNSNLS